MRPEQIERREAELRKLFLDDAHRGPITYTGVIEKYRCGNKITRRLLDAMVAEGLLHEGEKSRAGQTYYADPRDRPEEKAIAYIAEHRGVMSRDVARVLGMEAKTTTDFLGRLRQRGLLRSEGNSHGVRWYVPNDVADARTGRNAAPNSVTSLRKELSATWRGTWLQGLEAVL